MRVALVIVLIAIMIVLGVGVIRLILGGVGGGTDIGGSFGAGTDGGIYRSADGGATVTQSAKAGEVSFARYDILDLDEDSVSPGTWWAATEGAGLFLSEDQGQTWRAVEGPSGSLRRSVIRSVLLGRDQTVLLALDAGGRGRIWKSTDRGETFREVFSAARSGVLVQTLAMPRQETNLVLAGLSDGLLIASTDEGESWTAANQFLGPVRDLVFAPSDPSLVYAVVDRVGALRSHDRGRTWEDLSQLSVPDLPPDGSVRTLSQFPRGREVFSIAVHPNDGADILLATGSGLLRSRDGGTTFVALPVPLRPEALPVRAAAFDPQAPETIFATAGDGLYTSFDGGTNWRVTRLTLRPKLVLVRVSRADRNIVLLGTGDR